MMSRAALRFPCKTQCTATGACTAGACAALHEQAPLLEHANGLTGPTLVPDTGMMSRAALHFSCKTQCTVTGACTAGACAALHEQAPLLEHANGLTGLDDTQVWDPAQAGMRVGGREQGAWRANLWLCSEVRRG